MHTYKFITEDNGKVTCWCTTNDIKTFRDFMQYILDNADDPKRFVLVDTDDNTSGNVYNIAINICKMRKRNFYERLNNIPTGNWEVIT